MNTYVVADIGDVSNQFGKQAWYAKLTLCLDIERTSVMTYELWRQSATSAF